MAVREVLLLGHPTLYEVCTPVEQAELAEIEAVVNDLDDTLMDFRARYGAGRGIAAPQIGVTKRLVYMHIDRPVVFINPILDQFSAEVFELWDDCMSFPDLLVRVQRYQSCRITFRDMAWQEQTLHLEAALSELLQHEVDHLDGILAVSRAIDAQSFCLRSERQWVGS
ncbi:MAG: peptide deformylase [Chloroflexi bacterium]|nr:peptide deformylase [Chloroflexota bacterium]